MSFTLVPSELIVDGAITSAKLDTNISISGTLGVTGELTLATHLNMGDNDKIKIGTGADLEIYHDGSNSYIANSTGNIYIADTNGAVHIQAKLNEESIVAAADGAVTLYHDNSAKLATASGGVTVTGTLTADDLEIDSGTLSVDASNNRVGIGTTSPATQLHISGTSNNTFIRIDDGSEFTNIGVDATGSFYNTNTNHRFLVASGGTEALRITDTGKVGIGTDDPAQALVVKRSSGNTYLDISRATQSQGQVALQLTGGTGGTNWIIYQDTSSDKLSIFGNSANRMTFDTSGNVGIGTTSPSSILHIEGDTNSYATAPVLYMGSTSGANAAVRDWAIGPADDNYGNFHIFRGTSTGSNAVGNEGRVFTIASSGNVGIGTSSPSTKLHVHATGASEPLGLFQTTSTGDCAVRIEGIGGEAYLEIANASGTTGDTSNSWGIGCNDDTNLHIAYGTNGTMNKNSDNAQFFINSSTGNVGIGTESPAFKLDVVGDVQLGNVGKIKTVTNGLQAASTGSDGFALRTAVSSAANPTYSNVDDTNTGMFFAAADTLGFTTGGSERMRIDGSGLVKINVNNNSHNFQAYASSSNSYFGVYDDANDSANIEIRRSDSVQVFYVLGHTGNYHFSGSDVSDRDLKENIKDVPNGSLELVKQLKPRTYNFKSSEGFDNSSRTGFIAQEVAEVMTVDHRVASGTDGNKDMGIDPVGLIAHLTKAIQEQQAVIEDLKTRIETLEG